MDIIRIYFADSYKVEYEKSSFDESCLGDEEILVENHFSVISPGTELALYTGSHVGFSDPEIEWVKYPFYPGYSSCGLVALSGSKVSQMIVGETVCTSGIHSSHQVFTVGDITAGRVVKIPPDMSLLEAAFARIAVIPTIIFDVVSFGIGEWAVVQGLGLVGNFCGQLLRLSGTRVIGIDPVEMRRERARRCGLHHVIDPVQENVASKLRDIAKAPSVSTVIEATGDPNLVGDALRYTSEGGRVILLGSPRGNAEINIYRDLHINSSALIGAHATLRDNQKRTVSLEYVMDMIRDRMINVVELHTHTIVPERIQEAYQMLIEDKNEVLGVVLKWLC
jgi:2-desacetyl-2-hydroxyethyl bacteriochlorophyllide A dehydrogenase